MSRANLSEFIRACEQTLRAGDRCLLWNMVCTMAQTYRSEADAKSPIDGQYVLPERLRAQLRDQADRADALSAALEESL